MPRNFLYEASLNMNVITRYTFAGTPLEELPGYSPVDLYYSSTGDKNYRSTSIYERGIYHSINRWIYKISTYKSLPPKGTRDGH